MSRIPQTTQHMKKMEFVTHSQGKKQSREIDLEMIQMLELADHNFKVAVMTMLHEVRDYMFITNEMTENLSRELNSIKKKNYVKILEQK